MLLEILVALAVLSFGITFIFRILFGSMSALQHLKNRLTAQLLIDSEVWDVQNLIKQKDISEEYIDKKHIGDNPRFTINVTLRKLVEFDNLYKLEMITSWSEEQKNITIQKLLYVRKS
ncbi:hypothetical protein ACFL1E_06900 [Candidatus Omnitrophota bacterium]